RISARIPVDFRVVRSLHCRAAPEPDATIDGNPSHSIQRLRRTVMRFRSLCLVAAIVTAAQGVILADVLVLRDGRRVDGTLVSVRGDTIEFEGYSGRERGLRRYDRSDVRSIQLDDERGGGGFGGSGSGSGARPGLRERV